MPLVRIDLETGRTDEEIRLLADVVQECMLDVFAAPPRDRYQVITEHPPGRIILEDTGLGYERTSQQVVVHVFQQGRSTEQKQALYAALAERLEERCGLRGEDLLVSVAEVGRDDWSFGRGRAQFLTGEL
ncbi:tautomerase family protein [Nocardioides sp. CFH 31398]|uniref:tautomerase family protein n=1 Tax=Nocardioides sp. CFH 31398 TaxID=2919579 RepID=UPI001F06C0BA|nr:tautomerase family protein [Nocardioides sp. CFH 31398]MCH1866274.1 tautomerase family protein [Nocardioides sp. CFH 31398]